MANRQTFILLSVAAISLICFCVVPVIADTPVSWFGKTEFGKFELVLNADGSGISELHIDMPDWNCGPDTYSDYIGSTPVFPWPINDGAFSITNALGPSNKQEITISGAFESATQGAGTWSAVSHGEECHGTWEALVQDGAP